MAKPTVPIAFENGPLDVEEDLRSAVTDIQEPLGTSAIHVAVLIDQAKTDDWKYLEIL